MPAILAAERASLVRVLPGWTRGEVELRLLYPADRLLSRAVRAIVETIVERVPSLLAERWPEPAGGQAP